jgi:hypothetical protein
MEKVKVKQVDGAVDVSNSQTITGEKTFLSPIKVDRLSELRVHGFTGCMMWQG